MSAEGMTDRANACLLEEHRYYFAAGYRRRLRTHTRRSKNVELIKTRGFAISHRFRKAPSSGALAAPTFYALWSFGRSAKMSVGASRFSTTSLLTTHFFTPCSEGRSYMTSSMISSRIERRPRAPVLRD